GDAADQVDDEVAGAGAGVDDEDVVAGERLAELGLEDFLDAGAHEVDDGLGGVDDAHRVGELDAIALEEALVDGVEEVLLVGEVRHRAGGVFDGNVEAVEFLQVRVAVEGLAGHGLHDLHYLGGDDVAADELGVVKNLA